MCRQATPKFMMTNSMLLWWTSDSVPLPLVTKPKFVVEALQWSSKRRDQVQSYINQTELTSELNLKCNYFAVVERNFRSKNNWIRENC